MVTGGSKILVNDTESAHSLLSAFAEERSMTLGDAAALLIGLELMRLYKLNEDGPTRQKRLRRERRQRTIAAALKTSGQKEVTNRPKKGT